jgi:hypothetical protein
MADKNETTGDETVEDVTASELTLRHPQWQRRMKDDAQRDVVVNARAYVAGKQDRNNPNHYLYHVIDRQAALLDEQEQELNQLRQPRR